MYTPECSVCRAQERGPRFQRGGRERVAGIVKGRASCCRPGRGTGRELDISTNPYNNLETILKPQVHGLYDSWLNFRSNCIAAVCDIGNCIGLAPPNQHLFVGRSWSCPPDRPRATITPSPYQDVCAVTAGKRVGNWVRDSIVFFQFVSETVRTDEYTHSGCCFVQAGPSESGQGRCHGV
jgi:hypothetical protein